MNVFFQKQERSDISADKSVSGFPDCVSGAVRPENVPFQENEKSGRCNATAIEVPSVVPRLIKTVETLEALADRLEILLSRLDPSGGACVRSETLSEKTRESDLLPDGRQTLVSVPAEAETPQETPQSGEPVPADRDRGASSENKRPVPIRSAAATIRDTMDSSVSGMECGTDGNISGSARSPAGSPLAAVSPDSVADEEVEELLDWMALYQPNLSGVKRSTRGNKVLVFGDANDTPERPVWFLGDFHGDASAVVNAFRRIDAEKEDVAPLVVFLGDLFDRWEEDGGFLAVVRFLSEMKKRNGNVCWVAGNHDSALSWDEESGRFSSSVIPSRFYEWLNDHEERRRFGTALVNMISKLPNAVFLPGGVLASHGGFPHTDLVEKMTSFDDLEEKYCERDFQMARIDDVRYKTPSRGASGGHTEGFENFAKFRDWLSSAPIGGPVITRIVSAHQHFVSEDGLGARWLRKWFKPSALSLYSCSTLDNAMLYPQLKKTGKARPCMGRLDANGDLQVVEIPS